MKLFNFLAISTFASANLAESGRREREVADNSVLIGALQRVMEQGAHQDTAQERVENNY